MTRRLADRPARRLSRTRLAPLRPDHGVDLALVRLSGPLDDEPDARGDGRALRALAEENALLARELGRVQARCTQWRDDCIAQAERLEALLMRSRGEIIARTTQVAALHEALDALHQRAAVWLANQELVRRIADLRARNRTLEAELAELQPLGAAGSLLPRSPAAACEPAPPTPLPLPLPLPALAARRVLCVGGRARQVPVYRALVERRGGRFTHVDGAAPDCLPALLRSLDEADLVILQPGYVCQGACQAVEARCARRGVPCIQLDKTCALGFSRSLEQALSGS